MRAALAGALFVGTGGFAGALLRYGLSGLVHRYIPLSTFPYGTLAVNPSRDAWRPPVSDDSSATECPICGTPNRCLLAEHPGSDVTGCWCVSEVFPRTLRGRVPREKRGKACICRGCLERERAAAAPNA